MCKSFYIALRHRPTRSSPGFTNHAGFLYDQLICISGHLENRDLTVSQTWALALIGMGSDANNADAL